MAVEIKEMIKKTYIGKMLKGLKYKYKDYTYRRYASTKELAKLKGSIERKRCFIVGNGPSLTLQDLELLKNEDCFATNRIFKLFSKTGWRPKYYCSQDTRVLDEIYPNVSGISEQCEYVFLNSYIYKKSIHKNNILFFYVDLEDNYPELPEFSCEIDKGVFEGFTVTYSCIQMAVYLGYKEIYLLGIDHSYNNVVDSDGNVITIDNVKNYMPELEGNTWFPPQLLKSTNAYIKAKEVCDINGIVIKNATRGGKLEVFDRVDFDSLFIKE